MLREFASRLEKPLKALSVRFDRSPIANVDAMAEFVQTRASFIAQTSLYGYLKTRMGTKFREHFQDDVFAASMRMSAIRVFASCLSDLTIYAVALAAADDRLNEDEAAALARHCFETGLNNALEADDFQHLDDDVIAAFGRRAGETLWANAAVSDTAFAGSCDDLVRFAPVIDEYKALDREIVTNSIRFKWRDVRERLRKRLDAVSVSRDWLARQDA